LLQILIIDNKKPYSLFTSALTNAALKDNNGTNVFAFIHINSQILFAFI